MFHILAVPMIAIQDRTYYAIIPILHVVKQDSEFIQFTQFTQVAQNIALHTLTKSFF